MPSGGGHRFNTIPLPLPGADVLLGSGDLGGERVPAVWSELWSFLEGGALSSTPLQALPHSKPALAHFSYKEPNNKYFRSDGQLWS